MTWLGFNPTIYTREQYRAYVDSLPPIPWVKLFVLHNTGSPSLAQWFDGGVSEAQRLINLENYYEHTEHWHAGPHGFISPTHICGFSDPTRPGVHCSCLNSVSLGFEMVGDYSIEAFDSGPGAQVRDNAVFALAVWYKKLGLRPDGYRYGVSGLHFHKDCLRDRHECPGRHVDRTDIVARILAELGGGTVTIPPVTPSPPASLPSAVSVAPLSTYLRRGSSGPPVAALQRLLHLVEDGSFGPVTEAAVEAFQREASLAVDGIVGPVTLAAIKEQSK